MLTPAARHDRYISGSLRALLLRTPLNPHDQRRIQVRHCLQVRHRIQERQNRTPTEFSEYGLVGNEQIRETALPVGTIHFWMTIGV